MRSLVVIAVLVALLSTSFSITNVSSCGISLLTPNEVYTLNQSISTGSWYCISFEAANVTLDCLGYNITGPGPGITSYGVYVYQSFNATLRNCNIRQFSYGLYSYLSNSGSFSNLSIYNNSQSGIKLQNSHYTLFSGVLVHNNSDGIYLSFSSYNSFSNSSSYNNAGPEPWNSGRGLFLSPSTGNSFTNFSTYNNYYGIRVEANENLSNVSSYNNTYGLFIESYNNYFDSIDLSDNACNVYVSAGGYLSSYNLYFNSSYADGKEIYSAIGKENLTLPGNLGFILVAHSRNITVENQNLSRNWEGILIVNSSGVSLSNVSTSNNTYGIVFYYSDNSTASNVSSYNNSLSGIWSWYSNQTFLSDVSSYWNSQYGIRIESSYNNTISGGSISGNPTGLAVFSPNTTVSNLDFYNNSGGILTNSQGNRYSNITVCNGSQGFYFDFSSNNTLSGISICNMSQEGMYFRLTSPPSASNAVSDVSISNARYGMYVACPNCTFSNLTVSNSSDYGVRIEEGSNCTFTNLSVSNTSGYAIYLLSASSIYFDSANLSGNKYGIRITGWGADYAYYFNSSYLDARPVYSATGKENLTVPGNLGFILVANSRNITIQDQNLSKGGQALIVVNTSSASIGNVSAYDSYIGVSMLRADNCSVSDISAYNCAGIGIDIESASNSVFSGLSAHNSSDGIDLYDASNSSLSNIVAYNNSYGFWTAEVVNNTISNITIYDNTDAGLECGWWCNGNTLANSSIYDNTGIGLYIGYSDGNTIEGVALQNNSPYQIYLEDCTNHSIYNNIFNATGAQGVAYDDGANLWNATKTAGTNILGGPYTGGNYYSNYSGTDGDGDGIGDTAYSVYGGSSVDYLPLLPYAAPSAQPGTTLNSPEEGARMNSSQAVLNWTPSNFSSDPTCEATRNLSVIFSGTCTNGASCTTSNATADGLYSWNVTCYYGSENATSETRSFTVDATVPSVSITSPANMTYNSSSVRLNFTADDAGTGVDSCWYSIDGGSNTTLANCGNGSMSLEDGAHTLAVYANDSTGNVGLASVSFFVNRTKCRMTLAIRNRDLRPSYLTEISLDGTYIAFDPPVYFAPGERKTVSFGMTQPLCNYPGQLVQLDNVTLYYTQSMISGLTEAGSVPLVAKCG